MYVLWKLCRMFRKYLSKDLKTPFQPLTFPPPVAGSGTTAAQERPVWRKQPERQQLWTSVNQYGYEWNIYNTSDIKQNREFASTQATAQLSSVSLSQTNTNFVLAYY